MYRLATFEHENNSLLVQAIHSKNVYVFSYLTQFLEHNKKLGKVDLYDLLSKAFDVCTSTSHHRIPSIIIECMIKTEKITEYIDFIHERMFEIKNIELIKYVMNTSYFNPQFSSSDGNDAFYKIVVIKNEELVQMMFNKFNCSINACDKDGVMLVVRSVENDAPHISSLFIQRKCELHGKNEDGKSLLELCIEKKWYLHVTYILGNGYRELYDNENYFHRMCHLAVISNSTLIFDRLIKNFYASRIQRFWKSLKALKAIHPLPDS
jgi:hypothetical protein